MYNNMHITMDEITCEIDFYKRNRKHFASIYAGKHIIIKGLEVVGVYNSNTEAIAQAAVLYSVGSYIIERPMVLLNDKR
jgi:hypothetical protein